MDNTANQSENLGTPKMDLATSLWRDKEGAFLWQQRRHVDWDDNYTLFRDRVITNRLTQRQSVNVPLMKISLRTTLAYIDDIPDIHFDSLDNDEQQEIDFNEHWANVMESNKLEVLDIIDKLNVLLYGRSFKKLNILSGRVYIEVKDPYDILVDRFADPHNIHSAMFVIHCHIYKPLTEMINDVNYDQGEVLKIQNFFNTKEGIIAASENVQSLQEKNQRMQEMGAQDIQAPILGETWVECNEHFKKIWHPDKNKYIIHFIITTDQALDSEGEQGIAILLDKPLDEVIGKTADDFWQDHYPLDWWSDGVEGTDIWCDGVADTLRTPNKIINAWISQMVENRTLRNLGMMYYNSSLENYNPQTYDPVAFGFYGIPGKPQDNLMPVQIPALTDSLQEMNFLIGMAEKASAATPIAQGVAPGNGLTLGEIKILENNALQRMSLFSKFYNRAWQDFGLLYIKFIEAAGDKLDDVIITRKGYNDKMYSKVLTGADLTKSKKGFRVRVIQQSAKQKQDLQDIQTIQATVAQMPDNVPLKKIYQDKLLTLSHLTPMQKKEVQDYEEKLKQQAVAQAAAVQQAQNGQTANPFALPKPAAPIAGRTQFPQGTPQPVV